MIKHYLFSLLFLLAASLNFSVGAIERITTGYRLGYCYSRMDEECQFSYDGQQTVSAAIQISQTEVNRLAGNSITALRLAIHSKIRVDSITVWVASALDAPQCGRTMVRKDLAAGWNTIELSAPFTLTADQPLYIGYSYYQSAKSYVISAPQSQSALSEPFWLKLGDADWTQSSAEGLTLSLEAELEGETLPQYDMQFTNLSLVSDSVHSGQSIYITGDIRSNGLQPISQFQVHCEGEAFDNFNLEIPFIMEYGQEKHFNLRIPTLTDANVPVGDLTVQILTLDGESDEWTDDNTQTHTYSTQSSHWLRTVLCEEFTSEPCGNCPRVINWMAEAHDQHPLSHRIKVAAHHVGFSTDFLTLEESDPLTGFFNGVSFNPAIMCDRQKDPIQDEIVYLPQSVDDITASWNAALTRPTSVVLDMEGQMEADSTLTINVSGISQADCQLAQPHLTLMLVEDSIPGFHQAQGGENWIHQHTVRYISETWGEPISWQEGNTFANTITFKCPQNSVLSHCSLVALVSENAENIRERYVENSLFVPLLNVIAPSGQHAQDISIVSVDNNHQDAPCYDLQGRRITDTQTAKGFLLHNGRKIYITY